MEGRHFDIRPAQPEDSLAIGQIRVGNWAEQYTGLEDVDPQWIDEQATRIKSPEEADRRAEYISEALAPGAGNFWRVAEIPNNPDEVVGYIEVRKYEDGRQELHSIHLADGHRGEGIGQELLDAADGWLDEDKPTFLDVATDNDAAQRFYERNGYTKTGETYDYGPLNMTRMERDPAAEPNNPPKEA
jgi:ribosomal protein S18 acetylase RimI-like enzyme